MRDNHLHTNFSYDCETDFRDYLEHYDGEIVTTEHFDLSNPYGGKSCDDVPDYEAYSLKIAELKRQYGDRIKKGIEIGYFAPREADILAYLADKDYDLKLLSVHHNGRFDYLEDAVFDLDKKVFIPQYFADLEQAIERVPAHVLAHFDYGIRKLQMSVEELKSFGPELRQLFQKMIDYDLAFELNSKSMYLYGNEDLYRYALQLVQELGGQKFSVGSDGHRLEHFRLHFDKIEALLLEFGISQAQIL
ncbi:PHP domain-containing protein [Streptococcus massiliensis]|uniref:Histidinol-phosphatase n=1 Tax=Streptococcus massiliensis TaxID=313439 RepID=A0A380KWM9_9STRE|nr:PHP domain-containing protein [Streptococcus massiliensis]SUN76075.1 histidinol-phosphatase [Streptococcus massiliensis]